MCTSLYSQILEGVVKDRGTGETIPMANVIVLLNDSVVNGVSTDFDGSYRLINLEPNTYSVKVSFIGYDLKEYENVEIKEGKTTKLNPKLSEESGLLQCVVVVGKSERSRKPKRKSLDKRKGAFQSDEGGAISVRGGRSSQTVYFVDGVKVYGKPNLLNKSIDKLRINTHCVPAEFENYGTTIEGLAQDCSSIAWFSEKKKNEILIDESYEKIIENEFLESYQNPVTTFSIDVDDASYSNIRRFITLGEAPPKNAVRLEEMINYFDYDYPKPKEDILETYTELSTCPWNSEHQLLHIGLQSSPFVPKEIKGNNLVFLIDVSGSMLQDNKLPLVKQTLNKLTEQLTKEDKLSIVVYAGAAGCVLEPTSGDETDKIKEALKDLEAGGSTAGGEGIELAYKIAQEHFIENGNNRIIMATDGDFNVGISSKASLEELIASKRQSNVFLTVLGYGMGNYRDDKLELLADKGNGNYAYIDNYEEAKRFLIKGFKSTMYTLAKDVKLQLEFNPKYVKSYRLIGYENRSLDNKDFEDDSKDAGDLGTDQSVTALYEIIPANQNSKTQLKYQRAIDSSELFHLKIRYKEPNGKESLKIEKGVDVDFTSLENTSNRFRFSASVAMFGLILRGSKYKGKASCGQVIQLARKSKRKDDLGSKSEFIKLVRAYKNRKWKEVYSLE